MLKEQSFRTAPQASHLTPRHASSGRQATPRRHVRCQDRSSKQYQGTSFDVGKALQRLWTRVFAQQVVEVSTELQVQQPAEDAQSEPVSTAAAAEVTEAAAEHEVAEAQPEAAEAEPAPAAAVAAEPEAAPAPRYQATCVSDISKVTKEEWNACATGSGEVNPFVLWEFLHALELSGSAVQREGWLPYHLLVRDPATEELLACSPLYLKSHSSGEYVFDHSWANAAHYFGTRYYPKLQGCVPFSPVTGPRLLVKPGADSAALFPVMGRALAAVAEQLNVSGVHLTFNTEEEWSALADQGFLQRTGIQYHWYNTGSRQEGEASCSHQEAPGSSGRRYASFDEFLMNLKQSKRKAIRQERKAIQKEGLNLARLSGADLTPGVWDQFYRFYRNTTDHKWGQAYLTREFFHILGETMPQHVVLATAAEPGSDKLLAGALNLLGSHALFGRNWGCAPHCWVKHLHFELCYYQALEEAIERGLERVEAGAQGEHKIQRGYLPRLTYSSHYIRDEPLRDRIDSSLHRDRAMTAMSMQRLSEELSPYK